MRSIISMLSWIIFLVTVLAASPVLAMTDVTVSWQQPQSTEYLAGYRVRWATSEDAAGATVIDAGGPGTLTSYRLTGLPEGQTWVWVQVYDILGQESPWSVPAVKPARPDILGNVRLIITVTVP